MQALRDAGAIDALVANRDELKMSLDKMNPPPKEYETAYEKLQAALAVFDKSSMHVVKPTAKGLSANSYNRIFNKYRYELKAMMDELDIWIGDVLQANAAIARA